MDWIIVSLTIVVSLFLFMIIGVPIGFSLGVTSLVGILLFVGPGSLSSIANITWGAVNEFVLIAAPLFLLMSEIISLTGLGRELFEVLQRWLHKVPGSLAVASIVACAFFGAISGTGVGVAAVIGVIAIPEMLKRGYNMQIATGSVAGASALGMVIPPSLPLILYGVVTEQSVGDLFLAGVVPGIMLAALYSAYVIFVSRNNVSLQEGLAAMHHVVQGAQGLSGSVSVNVFQVLRIFPLILLIVMIIGGIYTGVMTPTEAAGVGVILSLIIAAVNRSLTLKNFWQALFNATKTSSMVMIILIGSMLFSYLLSTTQIPQSLSRWVIELGLSKWIVFAVLMLVYIILGMFLEVTSIVLITMPIVYPIITALGFDPIWFAIVLMFNMCIAVVSPPVGLVSYVVKSVTPGATLAGVFRSVIPFVVIDLIGIAILCIFPEIVTFIIN